MFWQKSLLVDFTTKSSCCTPLLALDRSTHLLWLRAQQVFSAWWNFASVGESWTVPSFSPSAKTISFNLSLVWSTSLSLPPFLFLYSGFARPRSPVSSTQSLGSWLSLPYLFHQSDTDIMTAVSVITLGFVILEICPHLTWLNRREKYKDVMKPLGVKQPIDNDSFRLAPQPKLGHNVYLLR